MKRFMWVILLVSMFLVPSFAMAGMIGPLDGALLPGKVSFGIGYQYQQEKFSSNFNGNFRTGQNQEFVQVNVGLFPGWEGYLRGGIADMRADTNPGWSDSPKAFGAIGLKGIVWKNQMFAIGPFGEFSYCDKYSENIIVSPTSSVRTTVSNQYAVKAGVMASAKVAKLTIYAGPYYSWVNGDAKYDVYLGNRMIGSLSENLTAKGQVGGLVGVKIPINAKFSVNAEGQFSDVSASGGVLLSYAF